LTRTKWCVTHCTFCYCIIIQRLNSFALFKLHYTALQLYKILKCSCWHSCFIFRRNQVHILAQSLAALIGGLCRFSSKSQDNIWDRPQILLSMSLQLIFYKSACHLMLLIQNVSLNKPRISHLNMIYTTWQLKGKFIQMFKGVSIMAASIDSIKGPRTVWNASFYLYLNHVKYVYILLIWHC
jgi:hypothetical protein